MNKSENLARIILRPDGNVHIVFRDARSIYATAANITELFSDPIDFIYEKGYTYKDSTFETNRNRVGLDEVLGLTLATVTSDKQIICEFPELFQYVFSAHDKKDAILNMHSYKLESILPDEKSFLLRYYLEFTNQMTSALTIKKNIKLRNEIQYQILREILNSFFVDTLQDVESTKDLATEISNVENNMLLSNTSSDSKMVSITEYARFWNLSPEYVRTCIHDNRLSSAVRLPNTRYIIDINEKLVDLRAGRKRQSQKQSSKAPYKRRISGSAAEVKQYIIDHNLFSSKVADFIHTYEELDYYTDHNYHEVCFDGQIGLIIDVNPEYVSNDGVCNRDLMLKGQSPHIPDRNKDEFVYHVHHVGQNALSPFAIIPEYDHNGAKLSNIFHQGSPNADLHGPEYNAAKMNFWRNYLKYYDQAGKYEAIEFYNHRSKKNKKNK